MQSRLRDTGSSGYRNSSMCGTLGVEGSLLVLRRGVLLPSLGLLLLGCALSFLLLFFFSVGLEHAWAKAADSKELRMII